MTLREEELWIEVVVLSLRDLTNPKAPEYAAREAQDWFSSDSQQVGSFCWVCQLIDLEPSFIREALVKSKINPLSVDSEELSVDAGKRCKRANLSVRSSRFLNLKFSLP
jgi:hypothetical protein